MNGLNHLEIPRPATAPLRPSLSTFIDFARNASFTYLPSHSLPQHFREAQSVASSITIGKGTSYIITRKDSPPARVDLPHPVEQQGVKVFMSTKPASQPSPINRVVYKIPDVQFQETGEPTLESRSRFVSVLLDFLVLTHGPVTKHKNVLSLLGLAWGNLPGKQPYKFPIPIVLWADYGSLAEMQKSKQICISHKSRILMDIATGLEFLHHCNIIHGDVKTENILIYSSPSFRYLAKLSDFGSSILGGHGAFGFYTGGTSKWAAPEVLKGNRPTAASDSYSFGLAAWQIAIDGIDPLSSFILLNFSNSPTLYEDGLDARPVQHLAELREHNQLAEVSGSKHWLPRYVHLRSYRKLPSCDHEEISKQEASEGQNFIPEAAFFSCLDGILNQTLQYCESARSVLQAKYDLESLNGRDHNVAAPEAQSITSTRQYQTLITGGFTMSYIAMRDLPPHISNLVFSQMVKLDADRKEGKWNPSIESCLTAGFMSGMGSDRYFDARSSVLSCARGAQAGITGLRALVVRLAKVAGATVQENMEKNLQWNAERGSLAAMEELSELSPEKAERAKVFMQRHGYGVGARFFSKVLGPFTYLQLSDLTAIDSQLRKTGENPSDIIVNNRGDTLIHAAASMGSNEVVLALLDQYKVPVNMLNAQEETPLLCAMRAGHVEVVISLLDRGANAGSISKNRETALHWLISISESGAQEVLSGLIKNGADIHNPRWALNCEYAASMISGYLSRWDHPEAGSPLHWAVSRKRKDLVTLLLEHGANHFDRGDFTTNTTAFEQAAYFHDHEILRIIIDSKYPRPRVPSFDTGLDQNIHKQSDEVPGGSYLCGLSGLIRQSIQGSDRYLMAVRWGAAYKKQLRETFQLLGEELRYVELIRGVDQAGRSPLQYAASCGFHEAAECIYEYMDGPRWLNVPYDRDGGITPIFASVKRDNKTLFNFLLSKGAKVDIRIDSPGMRNRFDWCILHTVAQYGDAEVAHKILDLGVPPDGYCVEGQEPTETPLAVAIENNNFEVADCLRERGADVNALSQWTLNSNLRLSCPMTVLGRIIASNLRDYKPRLQYLIGHKRRDLAQPTFVVAPAQRLTALHVSVLGLQALHADHQQDRDDLVASWILQYLLELFEGDEQVNAVMDDSARNTALHIAVHSLNVRAVELLLDSDSIRLDIQAANGLSAIDSASQIVADLERDDKQEVSHAREILDMLLEK